MHLTSPLSPQLARFLTLRVEREMRATEPDYNSTGGALSTLTSQAYIVFIEGYHQHFWDFEMAFPFLLAMEEKISYYETI